MKVTRDEVFKPVTIVLETPEEISQLKALLGQPVVSDAKVAQRNGLSVSDFMGFTNRLFTLLNDL